jgi:hypothetical protein
MKGVQFCTDSRRLRPHVPRDRLVAEGKMTGPKNEKRKVYAHYAAHCPVPFNARWRPNGSGWQTTRDTP